MANRSDNFNRADGSIGTPSDGGSAWTQHSGTWQILASAAFKFANGATWEFATLESSASNVDVEFAQVGAQNCTVVARFVDLNNLVIGQHDGVDKLYIFKRVSGTWTQLGSTATGSYSSGTKLKLTVNSSNEYRLYYGGVLKVGPVTESAGSSATRHGIGIYNAARFADDFSITDTGGSGYTHPTMSNARMISGAYPAVDYSW